MRVPLTQTRALKWPLGTSSSGLTPTDPGSLTGQAMRRMPLECLPQLTPGAAASQRLHVLAKRHTLCPDPPQEVGLTPPGLPDLWAQHIPEAARLESLGRSCCHPLPFSLPLAQLPLLLPHSSPHGCWLYRRVSLSLLLTNGLPWTTQTSMHYLSIPELIPIPANQ